MTGGSLAGKGKHDAAQANVEGDTLKPKAVTSSAAGKKNTADVHKFQHAVTSAGLSSSVSHPPSIEEVDVQTVLETKFAFDLNKVTCRIEDYEYNCFDIGKWVWSLYT